MIEKSICYFKTRGEKRATKGDKGGRTSTTMKLPSYESTQIVLVLLHITAQL